MLDGSHDETGLNLIPATRRHNKPLAVKRSWRTDPDETAGFATNWSGADSLEEPFPGEEWLFS